MSSNINSYIRDNRNGALINHDDSAYENAKRRKSRAVVILKETNMKDQVIKQLQNRLARIETLLFTKENV